MDETEIDIRAIIGLLRRRFKLVLVTLAVIVGATLLVTFALTPTYTASALVLVDTKAKDLLDPSTQAIGASADNARVESEVEILRADNILLDVIAQQDLITDPEFGVGPGWRDRLMAFFRIKDAEPPSGTKAFQSVLDKLKNAISIQRRGLTYLISVSATSVSPNNAARVANAVASAYIEAQVRAKIANMLAARDVLQSRTSAARTAIVTAEKSFDEYIANNIDTITLETGRTEIAAMRLELERAAAARSSSAATAELVSQNISLKNWVAVAQSLEDEALNELQRQKDQLASTLSEVAANSQRAIDLRGELARIDENLNSAAASGLSALRQSVASEQARATELRQQIRTTVITSNLPAGILAQIYQMQQNAEIARLQYQTLLTRVGELEAQAQTQIADSRIVSTALAPADPSFPNKRLILALAGISALGLGIGLAFLYENFVGGFTSEAQVESVLHAPVVAAVPHINLAKMNETALSAAEFMHTAPLSAFAESIRRLRAATDHYIRKSREISKGESVHDGSVIMVSSAVPGEGKSTIALSLGRTYAQSGRRTLLVDCDLRKPSLHRYLGVEGTVGLADYLNNSNDVSILTKVIVNDASSPLAAIVGSRRSETPTDQLSSSTALAQLVANAKKQFDIVILDTPPIVPVVDGLYLAEHADIIAMVVRWAATSQGEAKEAISSLRQMMPAGAGLFAVLNQQEGGSHGYRYKYAGYYNQD